MKKEIAAILIASSLALGGLSGCSSCSRLAKTYESDFGGGLNRVVTLYDYNGQPIKSWEGKIDLSDSEEEIFFDLDGNRVIIHGGITVVEEV